MIIGLTGQRHSGKSQAAKYLIEKYGFVKAHPFDGGKEMCKVYYQRMGFTEDESERMVNGDLKDVPQDRLPGGVSSRFFMEKFGKFLFDVGPEWTLGVELNRTMRYKLTAPDIVIESLVYEERVFRTFDDAFVIMLERYSSQEGSETSKVVKTIVPDIIISNNTDSLDDLYAKLDQVILERRSVVTCRNY